MKQKTSARKQTQKYILTALAALLLLVLSFSIVGVFIADFAFAAETAAAGAIAAPVSGLNANIKDLPAACKEEYKRAWETVSLGERGKELAKADAAAKDALSYKPGSRFGGVCKSPWDKKKDDS